MSGTAVTDSQREECAALVMQAMLEDYCTETGVSFNQALAMAASFSIFCLSAFCWAMDFCWIQSREQRCYQE